MERRTVLRFSNRKFVADPKTKIMYLMAIDLRQTSHSQAIWERLLTGIQIAIVFIVSGRRENGKFWMQSEQKRRRIAYKLNAQD